MDERDLARFERMLLPHLDAAYTLARCLLRDAHDTEDAVQETYLRAARYFHTLRDSDGRAWLFAILRRTCSNIANMHRAQPTVPIDESVLQLVDQHATPDEETSLSMERERVRRAMSELPPELREALLLREVSNCSYREIATAMDVPIGTVMSRLSRARARLIAQLGPTIDAGETA